MNIVKKTETPAQVYRRLFPRAPVQMVYADRMNRYIDDVEVWEQVLQDEKYKCTIEKKAPRMIPWLIESYQKAMKSWREIETPPDRLTTHRGPTLEAPESQKPVVLADILREMEAERDKAINDSPYWQNKRGKA